MPFLNPVTITASATLKKAVNANTTTILNAAAGLTVTLPASSGNGAIYDLFVKTTVSSNNYIVQVANSTDVMSGAVGLTTDISGTVMPTSATSDTITMNGTTTGGVAGTHLRFMDVVAGVWQLSGDIICTGTEATPFSAAV